LPGYTLPDGLTLKNKLGADNPEALEIAETRCVTDRLSDFHLGQGPTGSFDAAHLKAIHQYLFQDVYEWAGHTRDERIRLTDGMIATEPSIRKIGGQPFMEGALIVAELDRIAGALAAANHLRGLEREEFAVRAADLMVDLNSVHPFREGNGRTQRVFVEALAQEAGHTLDFSVVSRERMIQASIAGSENADPSVMRRLFMEISDPVRVAALSKAIGALAQHGFGWNDRYIATAEPGHKVEVRMAGIAGDQFMARTQTAILIGKTSDLPKRRPEKGQEFTLEPTAWSVDWRRYINDPEYRRRIDQQSVQAQSRSRVDDRDIER
jgi:cell filamentation protein